MLAVLTDPGVGGTFLTWSIYFLSGKTEYFSVRNQAQLTLPANPLAQKNAHNFLPNQPYVAEEVSQFLTQLTNTNECLYLHQMGLGTQTAVTELCKSAEKTIVLAMPAGYDLYHCKYEPRSNVMRSMTSDERLSNSDDMYEDLVNHFFPESKLIWDQLKLTDIWDKREFMALNFDPYDHDSIVDYIDKTHPRHYISTVDMWNTFDTSVYELFDYLGISIDHNRYQEWLPVYTQWRKNHVPRQRFVWYFDTIVNSILQGIEFDLKPFELDIQQEAAIQHQLIYKHNLNFKTWQLTKFVNTKQLHDLLEPNIHDLSKSLIRRLTT